MGYLTSSKQKPGENDPTFQIQDAENSIVTAWLINSMDDMQDAATKNYFDLENSSQMCEL